MSTEGEDEVKVAVAKRGRSRMPAPVRQSLIMAAFERDSFISIGDLAEELGVSGMTIRRDISQLEERGGLKRTHGGAVRAELLDPAPDLSEPAFDARLREHSDKKSTIAALAVDMVRPGEAIGIDVGTSTLELARRLTEVEGLRVITNSVRAASHLAEAGCAVYLPGGRVRAPELSVIGPQAVEGIGNYYMNRAFIGVSGADSSGFSDYSPEDSEVKHTLMARAEQVIVLCDSSKFGKRAMSRVSDFSAVHVLVTDAPPPADIAEALARAGTRVVIPS
ncbi:DeoR/GlpR family DNA-binding transcription regulator [Psychromarinibacter halotolerans]|uniref:DeoR/GlpR family DNA-binding transcription regulator n=1 Tax=Psychromarinibacter halotolerans TaxID=1775175 RepID=A0ABV7GS70_9RHOB|nr:DeoR/GlpR family DNA-binding transcription regulator [Psychromarinibacter halotolerans]MDF0595319.1 DeoR/GlpR family DNA-binding transcription regulator [Psychromarinibacter halotolerans]